MSHLNVFFRVVTYCWPLLALSLTSGCAWLPWKPDVGRTLRSDNHPAATDSLDQLDARGKRTTFSGQMAKAKALEKSGKSERARAIYQDLITSYPQRAEPYHRLAVVADRQRRYRESQALFTQAIRLQPRNGQIHADLGYCFLLQGKLAKAESSLLKATYLDPVNSRTWNNLGMVYGHQGRHEEALDAFRQAGSEADALYNLAFIFTAQDRIDLAEACFQRALAVDPTHEQARKALISFELYEDGPANVFGAEGLVADGHYVPYEDGGAPVIEPAELPSSTSAVRQAGHVQVAPRAARSLPTARWAGSATRVLHKRAQAKGKRATTAPRPSQGYVDTSRSHSSPPKR